MGRGDEMSSYTNVTIPYRFDTATQQREKIHTLESKIKWLESMLDSYERELQNIPRAIEEYGFVELTYDKRTIKIGIIQ